MPENHVMNGVPLYKEMARLLVAIENCQRSGNDEWRVRHGVRLTNLVKDYLPSGSGFDSGCALDLAQCDPNKIVISTSFHHMNEGGFYHCWTEHTITIRPSLAFGYDLKISGRDRDGIKDYIAETFGFCFDLTDFTMRG